MEGLSVAASLQKPSQLTFRLQSDWETITQEEKGLCIEKATEACKLICGIIAPNDSEKLFQALPNREASMQDLSQNLLPLIVAFAQAPTKNLKIQILSIYAYEHSIAVLQKLHEPYATISQRQIKRARAHARANGPGVNVTKQSHHRISLDMTKVDHFIDFVNRPYFHQDVAYGMRTLKLDSGETLQMPNIVRTVTRSTMISQYMQYCKDENYEPLSRATLYRILEVREASQRKSLAGLDNTAAEGSTAFQTLHSIVEQLVQVGVEKVWSQNIIRRLDKAKQYLKTDFKAHCHESESLCADHCRPFALSDSDDVDFQIKCTHQHTVICENCNDLKATFNELSQKLEQHTNTSFIQDHREDLLYDFRASQALIFKWKAHILRSVNQERAKQKVIDNLDDSSVLVVMDWAMKFIQTRFREKQSEWYGKRGLSWHISSVISKNSETNTIGVASYAHLFNECTQEWFAVASIIENLLRTVKNNAPLVDKAYLRSDEAGCYHNNLLIAAVKGIGDRVGVSIVRYDFSEPQQGKDICDRIICPLKSSLRKYCDEGNNVLSANDMYSALVKHPVRGATASVSEVDESTKNIQVKKIKKFGSYHNFEFSGKDIKMWKAFGVGKGKALEEKSVNVTHQGATELKVLKEFTQISTRRHKKLEDKDDNSSEKEGLFECSEPSCNHVFSKFDDLEMHTDLGQHSRFVNNENVYDTLRREWASQFSTITSNVQKGMGCQESTSFQQGQSDLKMGWALSKARTGSVRFSANVRQYLVRKFNYGQKTGKKSDPAQVAADMRTSKNEAGERLFKRDEWLTASQVKSFFSRLAKVFKGKIATLDSEEVYSIEINCQGGGDDDDDEEEKEEREHLIDNIVDEIQVQHPIFYDAYDLCDLFHQSQLKSFKVAMLKEICSHFDIQVKSKDRKCDLLTKLSNMIERCSCCK